MGRIECLVDVMVAVRMADRRVALEIPSHMDTQPEFQEPVDVPVDRLLDDAEFGVAQGRDGVLRRCDNGWLGG